MAAQSQQLFSVIGNPPLKHETSSSDSDSSCAVLDALPETPSDYVMVDTFCVPSSGFSSSVVKQSMVLKKGGMTGTFYNRRQLELLDNGELSYYTVAPNGHRTKKGSIVLTSSTRVTKRGGGSKRNSKFVIHHPLTNKEWYLYCYHAPKLSFNINGTKATTPDPIKVKQTTKTTMAPEPKPEMRTSADSGLWPFGCFANLNPPLSTKKGSNKSPPSKFRFRETKEERRGREEAEEWCSIITEMVSKCKNIFGQAVSSSGSSSE